MNIPLQVADKLQGVDLNDFTFRVLDVSTCMIPEKTAQALNNGDIIGLHARQWDDTGWIFYTREKAEFEELYPKTSHDHPELVNIIDYAIQRGFDMILLTANGSGLPPECGLPEFQW